MKVQEKASVHEKTVQMVATGELETVKKRRTRGKRKNGPVKVTPPLSELVDVRIYGELQRLGADPKRVQVISFNEAIVWNHPAPWPS